MSLASRTHFEVLGLEGQVFGLGPQNCTVLGSRTALFFESLKFRRSPEKKFSKVFFTRERLKNFLKTLFLRTLALESLASSIPVLGLERVCPRKGCCPWPRIFFVSSASSFVSSTPPLLSVTQPHPSIHSCTAQCNVASEFYCFERSHI